MPLAIQTATGQIEFNSGAAATLTFAQPVQQYLFGFQNFDLSYGSVDHHVQIASVSLNGPTKVGNTISTTINAQLQDDNGHMIDIGSSTALMCGVAWVGAPSNDATVAMCQSFASGGSSTPPVNLTGSNPTVLQPVMSGFYTTYGGSDHHVEQLSLSLSASASGSQATMSGTVYLGDDNGHTESSATITPSLLAGTGTGRGFVAIQQTITTATNVANIDFTPAIEADLGVANLSGLNVSITGVGAMVVGFNVVYPNNSDHHVKAISVGAWGATTQSTTNPLAYSFANVGAWMYDDSDNWSNPTLSNVTMTFIATYTTAAH